MYQPENYPLCHMCPLAIQWNTAAALALHLHCHPLTNHHLQFILPFSQQKYTLPMVIPNKRVWDNFQLFRINIIHSRYSYYYYCCLIFGRLTNLSLWCFICIYTQRNCAYHPFHILRAMISYYERARKELISRRNFFVFFTFLWILLIVN